MKTIELEMKAKDQRRIVIQAGYLTHGLEGADFGEKLKLAVQGMGVVQLTRVMGVAPEPSSVSGISPPEVRR